MESLQKEEGALLVAIAVILFTTIVWCIICSRRRRNSRKEEERRSTLNTMETNFFTRRHVQGQDKTFALFTDLGEDLMTFVLSFVADAPFEQQNTESSSLCFMSSLTHSLPLVSKQFYRLCKTNDIWKAAIIRQVSQGKEHSLWQTGLLRFDPLSTVAVAAASVTTAAAGQQTTTVTTTTSSSSSITTTENNTAQLVDRICNNDNGTTTMACIDIYKTILNTTIRFTGYIFGMPQRLKLGTPYALHFFEPRYRRLIANVMTPFPASARQGGPINIVDTTNTTTTNQQQQSASPPLFIHANAHTPLEHGTMACLVQVLRCHIHPNDGRADVILMPICHVRTERLWQIPNTGHLYGGQFMKLSNNE